MIVQKGVSSIIQTGKIDDDRNSRMLDTDRVWAGNCPWACFIRFDLSIVDVRISHENVTWVIHGHILTEVRRFGACTGTP